MRLAEVVVDFCSSSQPWSGLSHHDVNMPCSVKVIDCSSLSSSSVRLKLRLLAAVPMPDISAFLDATLVSDTNERDLQALC
jgi:hypothetical protein